ncbi:uncharacterized protein LOC129957561 isoform X2 [Argiope bruennichi]|uniref:uncharacterized protein LOC129957561 isoform X2 n=1 Tax=Argiope bruennichi TaxID=94029 RepID=UPI00249490F4|nr:uncharacterized protein LOC129957561 isoform X2 [Argiope bruennichi]
MGRTSAMTNVILPFLMSMLLGRTIDLSTYTISGTSVYDDAQFDEIKIGTLNTTYNVIQGDVFPYTFFGIPADIVLRIKSNFLSASSGAMGLDGILKDTSWKYNSAVVSVTTLYRTVNRQVKADAAVLEDWTDKVPRTQTHYAETLFYGGWSVVLFRFKCDIPSDVVRVKALLTKHLGVVGQLSKDTLGAWEKVVAEIKADHAIRGAVTLHTQVYSSVPLPEVDSPESLLKSIAKLKEAIGSLGQPLFMNLQPLHDLDENYPVVQENIEMLSELEKLDEMYDDVKVTLVSMRRWMQESLADFDDEQEDKIANLLDTLSLCSKAFSAVGGDVSLYKDIDHRLLDRAFQTYVKGLEKGISSYNLAFRRLKEEVDANCENAFLHKIRGLLRVYDHEVHEQGTVEDLQKCQDLCTKDKNCRAIGYAEQLDELDLESGLYLKKERQCWIYHRSTSTATVHTPGGLSGDMGVYDRKCY